jgi:alkyl hydroperoxide reductase subunit AhpC
LTPDQLEATEIVALSVDAKPDIEKMMVRIEQTDGRKPEGIKFLADPGHRVIDRYGLLNPARGGIAHPTVFVIDTEGIVRWKFVEINYKIRPTNDMIQEALEKSLTNESKTRSRR